MEKLRLADYSSNRSVDVPWTGKYDFTLHDSEDWDGGLIVTVWMEGVNFFSEVFRGRRQFCDVIVKSVDTGNLYYTKKAYLSEN